jgi:hypothetical protein
MMIKGRDGFFIEISTWDIIKAGFFIWVGGMLASLFFEGIWGLFNIVAMLLETKVIV